MSQSGSYDDGGSPSGSVIETLTGNSGGAVGPDGAGNVDVVGAGPISVTGSPGTNTLTIDSSGGLPLTFTEDSGSAAPAADNINILGGTGISTTGAGDTVTVDAAATVALTYVEDTGSAMAAANSLNILGGTGVSTSGAGDTVTINATAAVPLTFTEDTGSATAALNNLNVLGDATQGSITSGSGDTITITNDDATTTQKGVLETSTNAESIAGTSATVAVTPLSLAAKLGDQTDTALAIGNATTGAIQWTSAATDGQIVIGATGADPEFADLTSTGGTIDITPGANTLNIETAAEVATQYDTDSGSAVPAAGVLNILGTGGITTSGATDTVTIDGSGISGVSLSPYIVGATNSDFTTIQGAIDQAVTDGASQSTPANIYVKPGTYSENITIYDGICLMGFSNGTPDVGFVYSSIINGDVTPDTVAANVRAQIQNIRIISTNQILISGSNVINLVLDGVRVDGQTTNAIEVTSTGVSSITINNCFIGGSRSLYYTSTSGVFSVYLDNTHFDEDFDVASGGGSFLINRLYGCVFDDAILLDGVSTNSNPFISCSFNKITGTIFDIASGNVVLLMNCYFRQGNVERWTGDGYVKMSNCTRALDSASSALASLSQEGLTARTGSENQQTQAYLETSNSSQQTLFRLVLNEEESVTMSGTITAAQDDHTNMVGGNFLICARRESAGDVTLVGSIITNVQSTSAATFTCDVSTALQDVRIRVTGVGTDTYFWVANINFQKVVGT